MLTKQDVRNRQRTLRWAFGYANDQRPIGPAEIGYDSRMGLTLLRKMRKKGYHWFSIATWAGVSEAYLKRVWGGSETLGEDAYCALLDRLENYE